MVHQSWKQVFILNITITQEDPNIGVTYKGSSYKKCVFRKQLHVRGQAAIAIKLIRF